jgi:DNA-binding beta-propeller fold protein YncE
MRALPFIALALLSSLAACSGGSSAMPNGAPSVPQARAALARLVLKVPHIEHHRRTRYVSPATASLDYSVDGVPQTPVTVATSNPNCSVAGQTYLQCSVSFSLAPGTHAFSFTAKDAHGVALSANTNVTFDAKAGVTNMVPVTLGGIAKSLQVQPVSAFGVTGTAATAFKISGNAPQKFDVAAYDADGDLIVGPGAPTPIVAATPASMTVAPAASSAPNTVTLTSTYSAANDPTVTQLSSLTVTATPVPGSGGSPISATVALTLEQPWIYVVDQSNQSVLAFDEDGHAKTLAHPITGLNNPWGIVYDYGNGLIYVADEGANSVSAYRPDGTPYTLRAATPFAGLNSPAGLEYDPASNSIYVVSFAYGSGVVSAFDEQGNAQTLSGSFSGVNAAYAITYNPNKDWFYVANCTSAVVEPTTTWPSGSINTYTSQGAAQSTSGTFANLLNPDGMAYDSHNGFLYVDNIVAPITSLGNLVAYDEQGNQQTLAGDPSGLPTGWGVAYDRHNGSIYVGIDTSATPTIWSYDEQGFKRTTAGVFPGLLWPAELAVVP